TWAALPSWPTSPLTASSPWMTRRTVTQNFSETGCVTSSSHSSPRRWARARRTRSGAWPGPRGRPWRRWMLSYPLGSPAPPAGRLSRPPVGWRLPLAALEGLPGGAVKAMVRLALVEIAVADRLGSGLRAPHLDALAGLQTATTGARVRLPRGVVVERGRDAL